MLIIVWRLPRVETTPYGIVDLIKKAGLITSRTSLVNEAELSRRETPLGTDLRFSERALQDQH